MYETRAYDNRHGDPVVVMVVTGTHDVSRLLNHMAGGVPVIEQGMVAKKLAAQLHRHNGGKAAMTLLNRHGGADFTTLDPVADELEAIARRCEERAASVTTHAEDDADEAEAASFREMAAYLRACKKPAGASA